MRMSTPVMQQMTACMVTPTGGGEIGGFGGGSLEHPRWWRGAPSGPASSWECRAAQSYQARPKEAQAPSWGAAKGAAL
eukprot:scaffold10072_cov27-Phaeocystis_antarctica.AAC.2